MFLDGRGVVRVLLAVVLCQGTDEMRGNDLPLRVSA